jgi:1,4-dihydroxy-2-naphthoate octaprenyltransferase
MVDEKRPGFKDFLGPARIPFLALPPVCVMLGVATAYWETGRVNLWYGFLALLGAVSSHVSVNSFNEYLDFKSGLDAKTTPTPFSGGSGTLIAYPQLAPWALGLGIVTLLIPVAIGFYFLKVWGWAIVPIGIAGVLIVVAYTGFITRHPLLCLMAPGMGFGILWVMGTHFVLTGKYSATAFTASLVPFFLVSDLLLLNQFPDAEPDETVGREHLPIVKGKRYSARVYGVLLAMCYLSILMGVAFGFLPEGAMLGLLTIPLALPTTVKVLKEHHSTDALMPALSWNVLLNLTTPLLTAAGIMLHRYVLC